MKITPRDLRIDPPRLDAPDHVIERLSGLAAAGATTPARRRGAIVAAVTAGVVALGMGGAWASGAVEVPGLPKPGRSAPIDPSPPEQPGRDAPTPTSTPPDGTPQGRPEHAPQPRQQGHDNKPGAKGGGAQDQPAPQGTPPAGAGTDEGGNAPGLERAEERRPDHAGKPDSPGNGGRTGKPEETGKPATVPGNRDRKPAAPPRPQRDAPPKGRDAQPPGGEGG